MLPEPPVASAITAAIPSAHAVVFRSKGGFKFVYEATFGGRREALKLVFLPPYAGGDREEHLELQRELSGRIRREISLLAIMKSPNLVRLGSHPAQEVEIGGAPYVVYSEELLPGETVTAAIRRGGEPPSEAEIRQLLVGLLRAISELWSHRTIHRDIKPSNVMRTGISGREFVLLDLGIAYVMGDSSVTRAGGIPATHRYFAPEMARLDFRSSFDFRADVYTAGITAYEFAARIHPLASSAEEDPQVTYVHAIEVPPISLGDRRSDLSESLIDRIDQMLKKSPVLRPSNLEEVIKELSR